MHQVSHWIGLLVVVGFAFEEDLRLPGRRGDAGEHFCTRGVLTLLETNQMLTTRPDFKCKAIVGETCVLARLTDLAADALALSLENITHPVMFLPHVT